MHCLFSRSLLVDRICTELQRQLILHPAPWTLEQVQWRVLYKLCSEEIVALKCKTAADSVAKHPICQRFCITDVRHHWHTTMPHYNASLQWKMRFSHQTFSNPAWTSSSSSTQHQQCGVWKFSIFSIFIRANIGYVCYCSQSNIVWFKHTILPLCMKMKLHLSWRPQMGDLASDPGSYMQFIFSLSERISATKTHLPQSRVCHCLHCKSWPGFRSQATTLTCGHL